jgi:uncharacterized protein with FMN-binding domain
MPGVSAHDGSHKKLSTSLVALSSAAVLAVYTAGYLRTKSAADRFALQASTRRPVIPAPAAAAPGSLAAPAAPVAVATAPPVRTAAPRDDRSSMVKPGPTDTKPATTRKPATTSRGATKTTAADAASSVPTAAPPVAAGLPAAVVEQTVAAPAPAAPEPPQPHYKDGTYFGWGTSRHGDIQAQVVIEGGRIASATIAQCLTRYSCSVIARLPPQVAERQSPETDYVSGATQSADAFYYAVVEALSKAK